ncbi:MAG: DNA polymerase III subunit epsilon [Alistipes senegalensis]|nr:DNA polymerase III subunit epsilon [Oxalobacter formigenes]MCM1280963.1 DNA polymerase III subunit epsilon [Alistipes senegalensis]
MRQIVLDTETTGLSASAGDRIIEIGCVELKNRRITSHHFHHYINPERDSHPDALAVHGLTTEFLSDKPKFAEIADAFCDYIRGAELIIHNAAFDVGFLDAELSRLNLPHVKDLSSQVTDTLLMAREIFPGRRNSLDALCERYEIDNTHRDLHGALIDAALLAEVYLAMTRGQESLIMDSELQHDKVIHEDITSDFPLDIIVRFATAQEVAEHEACLDDIEKKLKGSAVWRLAEEGKEESA